MDRTAYTRALRAAAQVSFVALAGCGGLAASEPTDTKEEAACKGSSSGKAVAAQPPKDAGTQPSTPADASMDAAQLSCDARLKAAFPNGDEAWYDQPDIQDAGLADCCSALAKSLNPNAWTSTDDFRKSGCCSVKDVVETTAACTPWGPPMPPSMADWLYESHPVGEPAWC